MNPNYTEVAIRAGHRCEYCHAPEEVFNFPFEVEHIIPISRGGANVEINWALACRSCNLRKAAHISGIEPESQAIQRFAIVCTKRFYFCHSERSEESQTRPFAESTLMYRRARGDMVNPIANR